jgi:hypothetical protein
MKRTLYTAFFALFCFSAAYGQSFYGTQYFVGTPVNDSITSTPIADPKPGGCNPSPSYTVMFPVSKVTGVKFYMLINAVSPGNSVYTALKGIVHVGDTLAFSDETPSYDFYFPAGGGIVYTLRAKGTPQKADENYPCGQFVETTKPTGCPDIITYTFIQTGKVQASGGSVSQLTYKIMPQVNLAASSFSKITSVIIDASITLKDTKFEMYDNYGRKVKTLTVSDHTFMVDRIGIEDGTYFWKVFNNNSTIGLGKVTVTH